MNDGKLNRIISFLNVKCLVDAIYLDNNYQNINIQVLYVFVKNQETMEETKQKLITQINAIMLFDFLHYEGNNLYLIDSCKQIIKIVFSTSINISLDALEVVNDNHELSNDDNTISKSFAVCLNNMFIMMHEFYLYYQGSDYVKSFLKVCSINELLIKFLCINYLKNENGLLTSLYQKMEKEKLKELENIEKIISFENSLECIKLIIWFLNDYIANISISILSLINIDLYYEIKNKIVEL